MKVHEFAAPDHAFNHRFRVAVSDIDELGHANNVVWVRWINEAALAHCEAVGFGPKALTDLALAWVVRRHDIEYLLPALADQEIEAFTWPVTLKGVTSMRRTLFQHAGKVLARAETTWIMIDLTSAKPKRVPPEFARVFGFAA
ncbi:MAG: acyl-CoA thioesterase [Myxococcales bacterium]